MSHLESVEHILEEQIICILRACVKGYTCVAAEFMKPQQYSRASCLQAAGVLKLCIGPSFESREFFASRRRARVYT